MTAIAPAAGYGRTEYGRTDYRQIALVDLLDRVLGTGVVIAGDLTLSIADVDLVRISLRALVSSVQASPPPPAVAGPEPVQQASGSSPEEGEPPATRRNLP
jgi:Gas vesicle protein